MLRVSRPFIDPDLPTRYLTVIRQDFQFGDLLIDGMIADVDVRCLLSRLVTTSRNGVGEVNGEDLDRLFAHEDC